MLFIAIDYASIVLFFALLAVLLLAIIRPRPTTRKKNAGAGAKRSSPTTSKAAYGLLAALFVCLLAVAWLSEKEQEPTHTRK